jgi:Leucine-rich repeat (LRR) protein
MNKFRSGFLLLVGILAALAPVLPGLPASAVNISIPPVQNSRNNEFDCQEVSEIPPAECEALAALYTSTNGDNWLFNNNWLKTSTPSNWAGVGVAGGHITILDLESFRLTGTIPPELGNLSMLHILRLNDNVLTGPIPPELGNLSRLEILNLSYNDLTGGLPPELGQLGLLRFLSINVNTRLGGPIPPEYGDMASLISINLQNNGHTGSIPAEMGKLANLTWLNLNSNPLSGPIPAELSGMSSLTALNVRFTQISGPLPWELSLLENLRSLNLDNNQINGSIPPEFGSFASLQYLDLSNNQLSGEIPAELGNISSLTTINLKNNHLGGVIPPELGDLSLLWMLNLAGNRLHGSIPDGVWDLEDLRDLDLSRNALEGNIPLAITNLSLLMHYDTGFSYNRLYTTHPEVRDFLQDLDPLWEFTQTVPPGDLTAVEEDGDIRLSWTPIPYAEDGGYYEIYWSLDEQGPYALAGITLSKESSEYVLSGLWGGRTYSFRLRAFTPSHEIQQNELWSSFTPPVGVTKSGPMPLFLPLVQR